MERRIVQFAEDASVNRIVRRPKQRAGGGVLCRPIARQDRLPHRANESRFRGGEHISSSIADQETARTGERGRVGQISRCAFAHDQPTRGPFRVRFKTLGHDAIGLQGGDAPVQRMVERVAHRGLIRLQFEAEIERMDEPDHAVGAHRAAVRRVMESSADCVVRVAGFAAAKRIKLETVGNRGPEKQARKKDGKCPAHVVSEPGPAHPD